MALATGCNGQNNNAETRRGTSLQNEQKSNTENMKKTIVIFFSHAGDNYSVGNIEVGNTKIVADYISEITGADQFEIVTHKYDGMAYTPGRTAALRGRCSRPQRLRHRLHRRSRVVGHLPAGDVHAVQGHQPRRQDRHPLHHPRGQRSGQLRQRRAQSLPEGQRRPRSRASSASTVTRCETVRRRWSGG